MSGQTFFFFLSDIFRPSFMCFLFLKAAAGFCWLEEDISQALQKIMQAYLTLQVFTIKDAVLRCSCQILKKKKIKYIFIFTLSNDKFLH